MDVQVCGLGNTKWDSPKVATWGNGQWGWYNQTVRQLAKVTIALHGMPSRLITGVESDMNVGRVGRTWE